MIFKGQICGKKFLNRWPRRMLEGSFGIVQTLIFSIYLKLKKEPSLVLSFRFLLSVLCFFLNAIHYMQRANISVAIVCMLENQTCSSKSVRPFENYSSNELRLDDLSHFNRELNFTFNLKQCQVGSEV